MRHGQDRHKKAYGPGIKTRLTEKLGGVLLRVAPVPLGTQL